MYTSLYQPRSEGELLGNLAAGQSSFSTVSPGCSTNVPESDAAAQSFWSRSSIEKNPETGLSVGLKTANSRPGVGRRWN